MSALVWAVQWRLAMTKKRELVLSAALPFALVSALATGAVPAASSPAWYTVIFVAFGASRTALPLFRDAEAGLTRRVLLGGVSSESFLLQRAAAGAALTWTSLLPATVVIAVALHATAWQLTIAMATLALALGIASLLGVAVSAASRSKWEVIAVGIVSLVLLLHMSGVFRAPVAEGYGTLLESLSPFRALHESLVAMTGGGVVRGATPGVAWAVALAGLVAVLARRMTQAST